nr:MAG TPA: hypothetical protein [Caudoviricetes sp.]
MYINWFQNFFSASLDVHKQASTQQRQKKLERSFLVANLSS